MRYLFTALLFLVGCQNGPDASPDVIYDCSAQLANVVQFTLACIERANPKADEEPEDWIRSERGCLSRHNDVAKAIDSMLKLWVSEHGGDQLFSNGHVVEMFG